METQRKTPVELASTDGRKLLTNSAPYHAFDLLQPDSVWGRWQRQDYGGVDRVLSAIQRLFDAISNSSAAISLWIEQWRGRIETKHELDKWNRENRERDDHAPLG